MISVKQIRLSSQFGVDFVYGKVILNDTYEDISDYQIDLYKSNHSEDGFSLIYLDIKKMSFLDYGVNLRTLSVKYFYKVKITHKPSGEISWSDVYELDKNEPDNEAFYLIEVYKMHLDRVINNHRMILLNRKHSGQICSVCYDDVRQRSQSASCKSCFNTKYVGGYYEPQIIQVSYFNTPGHMEDFNPYDVGEKKTPLTMWTTNYPLIKIDDILVDNQNNRYVVTSWQPSTKNSYLIRQTVQMMMVPKSSIVYDIPINIDALKV
jgi:hypothetical protein